MRKCLLIAACLLPGLAWAQEDDRDYLTAFLEDSLSGAGRQVTVTGFTGALTSQATIEQLTIADDKGIWITLNGVVLDWSRSALLSGEVNVSELSAQEIIVARLPQTQDAAPSPEAGGFSLPDLPVSVNIDRVAAERIELGPEVLGQPVTGTLEAAMGLAGGDGHAKLDLIRTGEGPKGQITLDATYSNATRELDLSLVAEEDAKGIVVGLLDIPGAPSASLRVTGAGPIDNYAADILLTTDGAERLKGTIAVHGEDGGYRFLADVAGDLAPILAPEQVDFFGTDIALKADALRSPAGRITLDSFDLSARSINLTGTAEIAADGLPEWFDVTGTLAAPDNAPVILPFVEDTRVSRAEFHLATDPGDKDSWSGDVSVDGFDQPDMKVARMRLDGSGRIGRTSAGNSFGGTFKLAASGIAPADKALAEALGPDVNGSVRLHWLEGSEALSLTDIRLEGAGLTGTGALEIEGLQDAFLTSGKLAVEATDFARFSGLAGRKLDGSGRLDLTGSASRLSGFFDAEIAFAGQGLSLDIPQADGLLAGQSTLTASIRRDESGTVLRAFEAAAGGLHAQASGKLSTAGSDLTGSVSLEDLSVLGPGYGGKVALDGRFTGTPEDGQAKLSGTAQSLRLGNREADKLLAGASTLDVAVGLKDGVVQVQLARLSNPQLSATAKGEVDGSRRSIDLEARLANLGLIVPEVQGPLTLSGTATQDEKGYVLNITGSGPGQINATVAGQIANGFGSADLTIKGAGEAGLANLILSPRSVSGRVGYDLRLSGPLALRSLSGRVTLSGGRIADPGTGLSLLDVEAIGQLQGGTLRLAATSGVSSGGKLRVDGPIGLTSPQSADLTITLDRLRLYDPELYDTRVSGGLTFKGPLTGGALLAGTLNLAETEVRVPSSGFSTGAALLDIGHVREPGNVRETRRKAGLLGDSSAPSGGNGSARPIALNLTISAPSQIFIRGRGIDAELGGALTLQGTTADVRPSGGFHLIRGRMDILGRRLVLSQADLVMEGSLVPNISVAASTESDGITSTVTVDGPADDPEVSFTSSPELPQEEVLARLLFGRGLDKISALQAAQLANAVAVLAGRGGVGMVGNLRRNFGLDDLDVTTTEDGSAALKAGKYISENVYTEIEVDQEGKSRINLNLDLRKGVTVKGKLGADGETGVGIYLERDY
ncbi:MAG: translocation/assembly module TamB domain-containing protein [Rhodobacterales bacterium]|nr:translocation/assembly module TamB domain-containing protein [Rhodobacterales bacterium]